MLPVSEGPTSLQEVPVEGLGPCENPVPFPDGAPLAASASESKAEEKKAGSQSGSGLACSACKQRKGKALYSSSQLKKKTKRKCKDCVAAATPAPKQPKEAMRTRSKALQAQLDSWCLELTKVEQQESGSEAWKSSVRSFCKGFVPTDLSEDDLEHFTAGLAADPVWFGSLAGEIKTCAAGTGVSEVKETEKSSTFLFGSHSHEQIDREVVFVCQGGCWRAEG